MQHKPHAIAFVTRGHKYNGEYMPATVRFVAPCAPDGDAPAYDWASTPHYYPTWQAACAVAAEYAAWLASDECWDDGEVIAAQNNTQTVITPYVPARWLRQAAKA